MNTVEGDGSADGVVQYFAYGSNMDAGRMMEREVVFLSAQPALLAGYRLYFNKRSRNLPGSAAANVMPADGGTVEGVLYSLLDARQLARLDRFEGYPEGYRRESLAVRVADGATRKAWVYLANPGYVDDHLKPRRSYVAHLLAARAWLSAPCRALLEQVVCLEDAAESGSGEGPVR